MTQPLMRRAVAECVGAAFLLATVVGSGIMAVKLAAGNIALALLANALATGAMLVVLVLILGPVSGAHLNPVVSLAAVLRRDLAARDLPAYLAAQVAGSVLGVLLAHAMFELPLWQTSVTQRSGSGQLVAEAVATLGLLTTIFGCLAQARAATPYAVGLYIVAAYWFTASTSFANPAVTLARSLTDTFAGIAPANVPGFIGAQLAGMAGALALARLLWPVPTPDGVR